MLFRLYPTSYPQYHFQFDWQGYQGPLPDHREAHRLHVSISIRFRAKVLQVVQFLLSVFQNQLNPLAAPNIIGAAGFSRPDPPSAVFGNRRIDARIDRLDLMPLEMLERKVKRPKPDLDTIGVNLGYLFQARDKTIDQRHNHPQSLYPLCGCVLALILLLP